MHSLAPLLPLQGGVAQGEGEGRGEGEDLAAGELEERDSQGVNASVLERVIVLSHIGLREVGQQS